MDFNAIMAAIGSLGFPIVATILMGFLFVRFTDNYRADIKSMTEIVNNNTIAINRLTDKLEKESKDDN